jgi:hypothetical protein
MEALGGRDGGSLLVLAIRQTIEKLNLKTPMRQLRDSEIGRDKPSRAGVYSIDICRTVWRLPRREMFADARRNAISVLHSMASRSLLRIRAEPDSSNGR